MNRVKTFTLTGTSPASPGKSILATQRGLARYSFLRIEASLLGATGGSLDIYLQRQFAPGVWFDWAHFAQLAAAATAKFYSISCGANATAPQTTLTPVGTMNDDLSVGAFVLAADTFVGGLPGDEIRLVANAGASTTAGAVQTIYVTAFEAYT